LGSKGRVDQRKNIYTFSPKNTKRKAYIQSTSNKTTKAAHYPTKSNSYHLY